MHKKYTEQSNPSVIAWIGIISILPNFFPLIYVHPVDTNCLVIVQTIVQASTLELASAEDFIISDPKQIVLIASAKTSLERKLDFERLGYLIFRIIEI